MDPGVFSYPGRRPAASATDPDGDEGEVPAEKPVRHKKPPRGGKGSAEDQPTERQFYTSAFPPEKHKNRSPGRERIKKEELAHAYGKKTAGAGRDSPKELDHKRRRKALGAEATKHKPKSRAYSEANSRKGTEDNFYDEDTETTEDSADAAFSHLAKRRTTGRFSFGDDHWIAAIVVAFFAVLVLAVLKPIGFKKARAEAPVGPGAPPYYQVQHPGYTSGPLKQFPPETAPPAPDPQVPVAPALPPAPPAHAPAGYASPSPSPPAPPLPPAHPVSLHPQIPPAPPLPAPAAPAWKILKGPQDPYSSPPPPMPQTSVVSPQQPAAAPHAPTASPGTSPQQPRPLPTKAEPSLEAVRRALKPVTPGKPVAPFPPQAASGPVVGTESPSQSKQTESGDEAGRPGPRPGRPRFRHFGFVEGSDGSS